MTAVLPTLDHLTLEDFTNVYEPSEDTFLICDALEIDRVYFRQLFAAKASCGDQNPRLQILEIGTGSGCVITFMAQLCLQESIPMHCVGTDINLHAIKTSRSTMIENSIPDQDMSLIQCDLVPDFLQDQNSVDILLFNPPYVPTPKEEVGKDNIMASWAGGINGREVIDRVIPLLDGLLANVYENTGLVKMSPRVYMVLVDENKPDELSFLLSEQGFKTQIILKKRARNEGLQIMLIERE